MKKFSFSIIACLLFAFTLSAQVSQKEVDVAQKAFGKEKKTIVATAVGIAEESDDSFWTMYEAYEKERVIFGSNRVNLFNDYVTNFDSYNDKELGVLIDKIAKNTAAYDKALNGTFEKLQKEKGNKTAFKFLQVEVYYQSAIRTSLMESMFIIEDLGN